MDLKEMGINTGYRVDSAQDRDYRKVLVNVALNLRIPQTMESDVQIINDHIVNLSNQLCTSS